MAVSIEQVIDKLIEVAVSETYNKAVGEKFKLKDLFDEKAWKKLPRQKFGKQFSDYINDGKAPHIGSEKKTSANHNTYIII